MNRQDRAREENDKPLATNEIHAKGSQDNDLRSGRRTTPSLSASQLVLRQAVGRVVPPRLQHVSTLKTLIEQLHGRADRRGREVHVALGHGQVLVSQQSLDRPCRGAQHRQVRTKRVPQPCAARCEDRRVSGEPSSW